METIVSTIPGAPGYRTLPAPADTPAAVIDLRGIATIARRRIGWIAVTAALFVGAALVYVLASTSRYTATTQLVLDPAGLQILGNDLTPRPNQGEISLADVESQLQIALSEVVLTSVVEREKLADDPEFGAAKDGLLGRLIALITPQGGKDDRAVKALRVLQKRIEARRPEKTLVLNISVWTENGEKSARIANAIAQAYLEQESVAKADAARRTNASLVARLNELRQQVQERETRVERYKADNKLISSGGQLVNEQQLSEMSKRLTLAQERTAQQRSRYEEIERLRRTNASPDAIAEVTDSATFMALRTKYAEAKQGEANALSALGPRHPAMKSATAQVEAARRLVEDEITRMSRSALSDLNRSRANEEAIAANLDALKTLASETGAAQVKLRELEREAESSRVVYVAFLNRAKEVSEQRGLERSNARVITHALPPAGKSNPSRLLVLAGALGIGLIGGLGLALAREQFDPTIHSPDQISEEIRLPVLATLPRPPNARGWWLVRPGESTDAPSDRGSGEQAEVRRLRDALSEFPPMNETRLVLVTSPDGLSARSLVALDLARSAALDGLRVLLIDGDPRQHRLTSSLSGADGAGFREVLAGRVVLSSAVVRTPWEGVDLLTAGATPATDRQLRHLPGDAISGQLRAFDLVVIDGRLPTSDPLARGVNNIIDDVVIVVEAGFSKKDELREMAHTLSAGKMNVRGAVLVGTA